MPIESSNVAHTGTPERFRTAEAARYLKISPSTLEHDRVDGRLGIPFLRIGSVVLYERATLDRWLSSREVTPTRRPRAAA